MPGARPEFAAQLPQEAADLWVRHEHLVIHVDAEASEGLRRLCIGILIVSEELFSAAKMPSWPSWDANFSQKHV